MVIFQSPKKFSASALSWRD